MYKDVLNFNDFILTIEFLVWAAEYRIWNVKEPYDVTIYGLIFNN